MENSLFRADGDGAVEFSARTVSRVEGETRESGKRRLTIKHCDLHRATTDPAGMLDRPGVLPLAAGWSRNQRADEDG
jgi:hypothetical protein